MRKMRKLLLSLLLFPLALISCGTNKYYGYYAFQMGSDRSSHFGVFVDLTNEDYPPIEEEGQTKSPGKKFKFGMRVSEDMVPGFPETDADEDPVGFLQEFFVFMLVDILNVEVENPDDPDDPKGVTGYYNIGDKDFEDKGKKLNMNIILNITGIDVPANLIQKLIIAYINSKTIQMVLPVSVKDFQYQLCWYGMYIDINMKNPDDPKVDIVDFNDGEHNNLLPMPGPQGDDRIGSHPSQAEIEQMNDFYGPNGTKGKIFSDEDWFKDFNTLTVELLKS